MENILEHRSVVGVPDAILLEDYKSEEAFISNLRLRYDNDIIYTYIGQVLVSVNPYKELPFYTEEYLEKYRKVNFYEVPPHVFAISENAYRSMLTENTSQCILISGESGSGKTEASKHLLRHLAASSKHCREIDTVRDRLLKSNPILEAFGNAKTNRNDNSSRFGKYMDVECNFKGEPLGGHILNYLLEKSRVIHQEKGERNFHVFYQLLSGADEKLLHDLSLSRDSSEYHYLRQGGSASVTSIDDRAAFAEVRSALDVTDFTKSEQLSMWKIIAAVIHIGNVTYMTNEEGHALLENPEVVHCASDLLDCSEDGLCRALTHRTIEARGDSITSPLSLDQAIYARDALSKAVYERLFHWLVSKLNRSLRSVDMGRKNLMGILDIYGFEIFDNNGFEQFCINYCNEKLQQVFIELTLRSEQAEYLKEGIQWEDVTYFDNKIICDLIEETHRGIIAIMDEECLRPGDASDVTFLNKMDMNLANHKHYFSYQTTNNNKVKKTINADEFRLRHYAGDVAYSVKGFLDKNNDLLYRDLKMAMFTSTEEIVSTMFDKKSVSLHRRPDTAAKQFKNSLAQLMSILMSKEPSYIRCIKPNDFKRSGDLNNERVLHQVQYLGLMENLRVRRAGFAYRRSYEVFLHRYKSLCSETWPNYNGPAKEGVKVLLRTLGYDSEEYRLGMTKIFIRLPRTLFDTEDAYQMQKHKLASFLQAKYKGILQRRKFLKMRQAVTVLTSNWRRILAQRERARRKWASVVVRKFIRGFVTRLGEPNDDNNKFQLLVKSSWLNRLADNLPRSFRNHKWPEAPLICQEASNKLKELHRMQLVRRYVNLMSAERKAMFEEKILAQQLFEGKKSSYQHTFPEWFRVSRLDNEDLNLVKTAFESVIKIPGERTLYQTTCTKYDRNGYKPRERLLILTNGALYLLEAKIKEGKLKNKHRLSLKEVEGLYVSAYADDLLMVKIPEENTKRDKGDLILRLPNVIEAVTKMINASDDPSILHIMDTNQINHSMKKGKQGTIVLDSLSPRSTINKSKDGNLVVGGRAYS